MLNDTLSLSGINAARGSSAAGHQPPGFVAGGGEDEPAGPATEFAAVVAHTIRENVAAASPPDHDGAATPAGDAVARFTAPRFAVAAPPKRSAESAARDPRHSPTPATAQGAISLQTEIGVDRALTPATDVTSIAESESSAPAALITPETGGALSEAAPPQPAGGGDLVGAGSASTENFNSPVNSRHARAEASVPVIKDSWTPTNAEPAIALIAVPDASREISLAPTSYSAAEGQPVNPPSASAAPQAPDLPAAAQLTGPAQSSPTAFAAQEAARSVDTATAFRIALIVKTDDRAFELRLDPPDLGSVTLRFLEDEGGVQRTLVTAESRETLDLLRRHADVLQRELTRAGAGDFHLDFFDRREGDRSYDGRSTSRKIRFGETPEAFVAAAGAEMTLTASGRIDRFA